MRFGKGPSQRACSNYRSGQYSNALPTISRRAVLTPVSVLHPATPKSRAIRSKPTASQTISLQSPQTLQQTSHSPTPIPHTARRPKPIIPILRVLSPFRTVLEQPIYQHTFLPHHQPSTLPILNFSLRLLSSSPLNPQAPLLYFLPPHPSSPYQPPLSHPSRPRSQYFSLHKTMHITRTPSLTSILHMASRNGSLSLPPLLHHYQTLSTYIRILCSETEM